MFPEYTGLSSSNALALQKKYGPNILPHKPPPTRLEVFLSQLKNPFVYVLLIATLITLFIGHISDAVIIMIAVLINTILGYVQEYRASNALSKLKSYLTSRVKVKRDGKLIEIDTEEIVPGDTLILDSGNRVPADAEVIFANRLMLDEALLTGESQPVKKEVGDEVYMGTIVAAGQVVCLVKLTGSSTKMGQIALQLDTKSAPTPLEHQLAVLSRQILVIIAVLLTVVVTLGIWRRLPLSEIFITAVALAVSSIPEGLIVSLTIILAIGMQKIMKHKGLVRQLSSAETLGGVTIICVDKTGTLTTGKLAVIDTYGSQEEIAKHAVLTSDHDDPMVTEAYRWGQEIIGKKQLAESRLDSIPFSSETRFTATLIKSSTKNILYVSGAPETIIKACAISDSERKQIETTIQSWTEKGRRVIAYSNKDYKQAAKISDSSVLNNLKFTGLISFADPVRTSVKNALREASRAGIKLLVITGDYAPTALDVLKELEIDISSSQVVLGDDFAGLGEHDQLEAVKSTILFARTTPSDKYLIVQALKKQGEVVAMMGDGVNDAPALHLADIGIVVDSATDVARETADLVLLDSNFETIIRAIKEGRAMFDNIRKIILYLLCDAFAEIIVVITAIAIGVPLPLTAAQILWINIVSDGFPSLALTVDPERKGIMNFPPRRPKEPLVNRWMISLIAIVSIFASIFAFGSFYFVYQQTGDETLSRSMSFLVLGLNSLAYVFSVRLLTTAFWRDKMFSNRYLILAVLVGFFLQSLPFIVPGLRGIFGTVSLGIEYWTIAIGLSVMIFFVIEIFKYLLRLESTHHKARS